MKKLLFSLLTMAFALASQAQITGHFMGLKMGFSSMEDAIDVFEVHGIQYEVEDNMSLAFSAVLCWRVILLPRDIWCFSTTS